MHLEGTRSPRAVHAPARSTPTCQTDVAAPISELNTAVAVYPPTAVARRLRGSSARAPPANRAPPASASAIPSIPSAAAGAPGVEVTKRRP